ncbi:MAG: hypothetical protein HON94_17015 [Methylococcales bacterium]|jgi:hypothetical protein|nr:hypothetical protein [Methylococcales bacterium]
MSYASNRLESMNSTVADYLKPMGLVISDVIPMGDGYQANLGYIDNVTIFEYQGQWLLGFAFDNVSISYPSTAGMSHLNFSQGLILISAQSVIIDSTNLPNNLLIHLQKTLPTDLHYAHFPASRNGSSINVNLRSGINLISSAIVEDISFHQLSQKSDIWHKSAFLAGTLAPSIIANISWGVYPTFSKRDIKNTQLQGVIEANRKLAEKDVAYPYLQFDLVGNASHRVMEFIPVEQKILVKTSLSTPKNSNQLKEPKVEKEPIVLVKPDEQLPQLKSKQKIVVKTDELSDLQKKPGLLQKTAVFMATKATVNNDFTPMNRSRPRQMNRYPMRSTYPSPASLPPPYYFTPYRYRYRQRPQPYSRLSNPYYRHR